MTTQLGIITNYNGNILNGGDIISPTLIELNKWYGLTNTKGPMKSDGLNITDMDGITTNNDRLNKYFKGKFDNFDKISKDSQPNQPLEPPFKDAFNVKSLIIIYLEAEKNSYEKWNTTDSLNDNRIYLFDNAGNEVRTRATTQDNNKSKFYEIKIVNNELQLLKDNIEVIFSFKEAAMTLAKLISDLLGTEITYKGQGPDKTVTRTPGVPTRATPAAAEPPAAEPPAAVETADGAAETADGAARPPTAVKTADNTIIPADRLADNTNRRLSESDMQPKVPGTRRRIQRTQDTLDVDKNNSVPQREVGEKPPVMKDNFVDERPLELGSARQSQFVDGNNNKPTTGGKKTRKRRNRKTKKNKGGKKSRKQIKSMRKMKRSSSKK